MTFPPVKRLSCPGLSGETGRFLRTGLNPNFSGGWIGNLTTFAITAKIIKSPGLTPYANLLSVVQSSYPFSSSP